jgi:hypothetical protein
MTTTMIDSTYTIRPAGQCAWAEHQAEARAITAAEEARDLGLRRVLIVGEQTGALYHVDVATGSLVEGR